MMEKQRIDHGGCYAWLSSQYKSCHPIPFWIFQPHTFDARTMYPDAEEIDTLILHIIWLCIDVRNWINPRFRALFPTFDHLVALYSEVGIRYCDGLLDILEAADAPPVTWFRALSGDLPRPNIWGVYVLVLQKADLFKLYIGSGTSTVNNGVRYRILQHQGRRVEPHHLAKAKDDGFEQVHCALLATCEVPTPALVPVHRSVIVALEAVFHYIFWPMCNRQTNYGFPDSMWPRSEFEWGGTCSHNPLHEGVISGSDDLELTSEQLEAIAAAALQRRREVRREWDRRVRANQTPEYRAYRLECSRRWQPKAAAIHKRNVDEKKFHCSLCDVSSRNKWGLERHEKTARHKAAVADGCGLYCEPCKYQAPDRYILHRHQSSARHKRLMEASEQEKNAS